MCLLECQLMACAVFVKYAHTGIHILTTGHKSCLTDQGRKASIHSSQGQDHHLLVQTARIGYTNHFQGLEQCWLRAAARNHPETTGALEEVPRDRDGGATDPMGSEHRGLLPKTADG